MAVSVVIPTYNYERFIDDAIRSVQRQTWTDWDCVIVDDGSTDGTGDIARRWEARDHRIHYVRVDNAGPNAARNFGLAATSGDFVQFLDADDMIGPGKLARQVDLLSRNPAVDIAYGDSRYFRGHSGPTVPPMKTWVDVPPLRSVSGSGPCVVAELLRDNVMTVHAALIRRSLLERVGGFDASVWRMEDWECWLRCAIAGGTFLHDTSATADCLSYVRMHEANSSQDRLEMIREAVRVRHTIHQQLPTPGLRRLNTRRIHDQWAEVGILEGLGDSPISGIRWLLRAGAAELRIKWLAWAMLVPVLRSRPGLWALRRWRGRKARQNTDARRPYGNTSSAPDPSADRP